ncbi:hypothetical protein C8R44DRAFT_852922 [Mycena epipterygia]|nr:hypothetical protein C8R44DRAFT_852922 [Mycena epipterygia]
MPVTFAVASHKANPVALPQGQTGDHSPRQFLELACKPQARKAGEILQSSLNDDRGLSRWRRFLPGATQPKKRDAPEKMTVIPTRNGFVDTAILAYNKHHALIIRPDDVWLAILTQFNYFVNANSELLRASFVAHEGKRELVIIAEGTRYTLDFGAMSRQMVGLLEKNVVDPGLRAWVLPTFTTTTENDTTVAAMLMMATLKAYFDYVYSGIYCGIPRVTLEGEKADWEDILGRLEKLKEYGVQTIAWYHLLVPVISRFVKSFDEPNSPESVKFWQQIAHFEPGGSGPSHYTGWINAFCVFNEKGRWMGHTLRMDRERPEPPETLSAQEFNATYVNATRWTGVDCNDTPPGYAEVDVKLVDQGKPFDCALTAGLVGTHISSSDDTTLSETGKDDTVRPLLGWWMFIKK